MTSAIALRHCTVAGLLLLLLSPIASLSRKAEAQNVAGRSFHVFLRGADAGTEEVTVLEGPDGWTLRGSGRLTAPLNLVTEYWEARYDRDWKPIELSVNFAEGPNKWTVHTTISGTLAASDVAQNGQNQRRNQSVAADTIVLPNLIFGAYEALAARLASAQVGAQLEAFVAPQNVVPVNVTRVTTETIQIPGRTIAARRWTLHFGGPAGALDIEVWTEGSRLLRLDIPSQMLSVIRDDIASVSARLVTLGRSNDEQVTVPTNGFSLAATISRPALAVGRLPGIVLVSGSTSSDRDEIIAGVPIFAQLATSLSDAGFVVARYDERGAGQSGGRPEAATFDDFANDARAIVTFLGKRKDVDPKKLAVIGYGDGGWVASIVAAKEARVAALAVIGTPSISGMELVLEQQRQMFDRGGATTVFGRDAAVEQQKTILQAVISGKGWEAFPTDLRRRVDTPLYRSFLLFDPAQALSRVRQPMLIVHADLDREIPLYHGEQLAQLARARPRAGRTDFVHLPGLNHLLTRATTGDLAEYGTLAERNVSPDVVMEIASWLKKVLLPPAAK